LTLEERIDALWETNSETFCNKTTRWLKKLENGQEVVKNNRRSFHKWYPLKVYVSVSKAESRTRTIFSLRYAGQEVAKLRVNVRGVFLYLNQDHVRTNNFWFHGFEFLPGEHDWHGKFAQRFRSYFKKHYMINNGMPNVRSVEHRTE